jgi:hypothetical protein
MIINNLEVLMKTLYVPVYLLLLAVYSFSAGADTVNISNQITVVKDSDKTYSFSDIDIHCNGDTIQISGRVKSTGKQLRGHIDIAVFDSSGTLQKKISVKPYFNNRPGIGNRYTVGFPFRARISLDKNNTSDKYTVRLVLHRDSKRNDSVYECGANKAL